MKKKSPDADVIKNSEGLEYHPTDRFVHWSEKNRKVKMIKLRTAYDNIKLVKASLIKDLEFLMEAAYQSGIEDEADSNNPDL